LPEDFVSVPDRPSSRKQLLHFTCEFAPPNFTLKLVRPGFGPASARQPSCLRFRQRHGVTAVAGRDSAL
jgi:hypothetical protein